MISAHPDQRRQWVSTSVGLGVGGVAFVLTLLNYGTDLTRTALAPGYFSQFFDLQARALLAGHLDVPAGSLGIEGFVHDGRTYTYFPPFPALLRLPVLMTTHEFDYRLTVLSMALAWVVLAVMATKLIWLVFPLVTGVETISRLRCVLASVFLAAASGGTFVTYDASLPWVYHEVYVWAVAAAVGGIYWMVRVLARPDSNSVKWLFVFALLAVGVRATEGWALSLVTVAIALAMRFGLGGPGRSGLWWRVLLAGAIPLAASIALNLYKFDAIYMFPLKDQVWTQISEQRRHALAANGGSLTGPQFFTTSFMAYLRPDGIRFVDYFPWITLPAKAAPAYGGAVVDQTYRTGSVTAFMPLFMVLEIMTVLAVFRPRARREMKLLRWPVVTAILITGGVMGYGYYANRYASEFVPALVLGGAVGTCLVAGWLERHPRRWRAPVLSVMAVATLFSILAQMSTGLAAAAYNHRGAPLERYVQWQMRFSPDQQAQLVSRVAGLPAGGQTDDLAIRGRCDALYIHTGDKYEPWLPVEERDRVLRLDYRPGQLQQGEATVLTVTTTRRDRIDLQVDLRGQVRFIVYRGEDNVTHTPWFDPPTERGITLGIRNLIDFGAYEFTSNPGGVAGYLPSIYLNDREDSLPADLQVMDGSAALARLGFTMTDGPGLPLQLCNQLATHAHLDLSSP